MRASAGAPIWLVDPNDGTRDYLEGRRGSAVVHRPRVRGAARCWAWCSPSAIRTTAGDLFAWAEGAGPLTPQRALPGARAAGRAWVRSTSCSCPTNGDRDPETNLQLHRARALPGGAQHRASTGPGGRGRSRGRGVALCARGLGLRAPATPCSRAAGGSLMDEDGRDVAYRADGDEPVRAGASAGRRGGGAPGRASRGASAATRTRRERRVARLGRGRGRAPTRDCCRARRAACWARWRETAWAAWSSSSRPREIAQAYPDGPRLLADGGAWNTLAGQPTDDSEMALALARADLRPGRFDAAPCSRRTALGSAAGPSTSGRTTGAALAGSPNRREPGQRLPHAREPARRLRARAACATRRPRWRARDSALTHPHPVCGDAVGRFRGGGRARDPRHGDGPEAAYAAALALGSRRRRRARPCSQALDAARDDAARLRRRVGRASCSSPCRTPSTSCSTPRAWRTGW